MSAPRHRSMPSRTDSASDFRRSDGGRGVKPICCALTARLGFWFRNTRAMPISASSAVTSRQGRLQSITRFPSSSCLSPAGLFFSCRPTNHSETLGRHIVVAWNSSRPAARSLNDALPLIERAERTTIVMINPSGFIGRHEGPPGEQMVEHLKRHGATVDAVRIEDVARGAIADQTAIGSAGAGRGLDRRRRFRSSSAMGENARRRHQRSHRAA